MPPPAEGSSYTGTGGANYGSNNYSSNRLLGNSSMISGRSNTSNTTEKRGIKLKNVRLSVNAMKALNTKKLELRASQ